MTNPRRLADSVTSVLDLKKHDFITDDPEVIKNKTEDDSSLKELLPTRLGEVMSQNFISYKTVRIPDMITADYRCVTSSAWTPSQACASCSSFLRERPSFQVCASGRAKVR